MVTSLLLQAQAITPQKAPSFLFLLVLHFVGVANSVSCEYGHKWEKVIHLLPKCVRFKSERNVLRQRLDVLDKPSFAVWKVLELPGQQINGSDVHY